MARKHYYSFLLPVIIVACSVVGGLYGTHIPVADAATSTADIAMGRDLANFTRVYALVEENAAEKLDPDKAIYHGAIPGMLRTLDPHSNFFDPKEYRALREEQSGTYYGVGMHVAQRGGKTVVVAPFPGSPAYKAGLRPGDIIVSVDGKSTDGLNVTEVADLLKGARGTPVQVSVSREGSSGNLTFSVVRDEISRKSVPDGFFVQPGVAYIKIESFAEGTPKELDDNLKRLGEANIKGLILDLRQNPGGLLNSGVAVADHFLQKGQLIVSHHGRASSEKAYSAYNGNHGRNYPIVVLVDRYTASAAEIVSGALQDHDRGLILGETTFGKGLVQTVFPLYEHTGLALTTAHFYTPSGRLIQRDYTNKSFYDYYFHKDDNARNPLDVKATDSGRTVYGGGGITPDEKYQDPKLDSLQGELLRNALFGFTRDYFSRHGVSTLPKDWMPDANVVEDLHDYLVKKSTKFTEADFTKDHDWIRRYLAREMYIYAFGEDESNRMFASTDPEVQKAVDAMPRAQALADTARKVIVERMNGSVPRPGLARR